MKHDWIPMRAIRGVRCRRCGLQRKRRGGWPASDKYGDTCPDRMSTPATATAPITPKVPSLADMPAATPIVLPPGSRIEIRNDNWGSEASQLIVVLVTGESIDWAVRAGMGFRGDASWLRSVSTPYTPGMKFALVDVGTPGPILETAQIWVLTKAAP